MASRIGVDVGGTFTDLIFLDETTGRVTAGKRPTTPSAPEEGVLAVVQETIGTAGLASADYFLHGTTVGLNALLERKGARVGIVTTAGFRDVLEIRREMRVDERGERLWDLLFKTPAPLVPRRLRIGVDERVLVDGSEHRPLDIDGVNEAAALFTREGVECVAIIFINSHANPAHELAAAEALRSAGFTGDLSLSHQVTGEFREYERTSTTVIDAYVRPVVSGYLNRLERGLRDDGFTGECLITTSSGGATTFAEACLRPFETITSGPVAGAVGSGELCRQLDLGLAITADVGGTSFDTCLLADNRPRLKYEGDVVGMPLQAPWVDVRSVGAGGGSIAYVDAGLLHVGPESSGAEPGPACYGRGGTQPTVTDAALLLGMLGDGELASGMVLDRELAQAAVEGLAESLGLTLDQVAQGIVQIAGVSMAGAIRTVSTEIGVDPRDCALIAYGGAGPLFGCLLARELGARTLVVPNHAGNFSAWGLLWQDLIRTAALSVVRPLDSGSLGHCGERLADLFAQLEARGDGSAGDRLVQEASLDMRYLGQEYSLTVGVPYQSGGIASSVDEIATEFGGDYERSYGHRFEVPVEIVSVRAAARTELPRPTERFGGRDLTNGSSAARGLQAFSFTRSEWCEFAAVSRATLDVDSTVPGPAIVSEHTTTTYIDAGFSGRIDATGSLIITDEEGADTP
jgi:N-methylhydantoinase A